MKKLFLTLSVLLAASVLSGISAQEKPWIKYITPSGYFQAGYSSDFDFNNSFYIKRARIALSGTLYETPEYGKFEYKVQAELANSPKLVDYFIKYTVCDEFGVQFGQFKSPLSYENSECPPLKLEMIDYSLLVQRFCRMSTTDLSGISATGREIGLQFYGKAIPMVDGHSLIRYNVGVFNGNGINKMDDDKRKNLIARLMVYPIKDLCLVGYYERAFGPFYENVPSYDYDGSVFDRYGGGLVYDSKYAWFRAEYMAGHTLGYRNEGAYGTAGYKINDKIGVGLRYDYFNENSKHPGYVQQYYTAGAYWYPHSRFRVQLNYTIKRDPGVEATQLINLMTSIIL